MLGNASRLAPTPPPTMRSCFTGIGREGVIARELSHPAYKPPSALCTEAKVAQGGGGGHICGTLRYVTIDTSN